LKIEESVRDVPIKEVSLIKERPDIPSLTVKVLMHRRPLEAPKWSEVGFVRSKNYLFLDRFLG